MGSFYATLAKRSQPSIQRTLILDASTGAVFVFEFAGPHPGVDDAQWFTRDGHGVRNGRRQWCRPSRRPHRGCGPWIWRSIFPSSEWRVDCVWGLPDQDFQVARRSRSFLMFSQADALLASTAALVRQGEQWQVFVLETDQARARAVQLKDCNTGVAWIREGFKAVDTMVL